jgi:CPA1 family monovalent cation:H+ antiporter
VALALSLPADLPSRDLIVTMTYVVVVFSIVVQGLTVGRLIRWIPEEDLQEGVPPH